MRLKEAEESQVHDAHDHETVNILTDIQRSAEKILARNEPGLAFNSLGWSPMPMGFNLWYWQLKEAHNEPVYGKIGAECTSKLVEKGNAMEGAGDHDVPYLRNLRRRNKYILIACKIDQKTDHQDSRLDDENVDVESNAMNLSEDQSQFEYENKNVFGNVVLSQTL